MNYEYYKIFYYVGKHKNITRAATELYSSQPAVTRAVQNLENELGCRLFIRTKSGVDFTHEGQLLFDYVKVACQQLIKAEDEISHSVSLEGGTVYIGATVSALHCFLFDFLDEYLLKYPNVKFKIFTSSSDKTIESLKSGMVDLAFVTTPCTVTKPCTVTNIARFDNILVAGKKFEHLKGRIISLDELQKTPFICLSKGMQLRQFVEDYFSEHGVSIVPDIEADTADLLVPMVAHNWGLAFVPEDIAAEAIANEDIFEVQLKDPLPERYVCLVSDPHHPQTRASRELARMITSKYKIK